VELRGLESHKGGTSMQVTSSFSAPGTSPEISRDQRISKRTWTTSTRAPPALNPSRCDQGKLTAIVKVVAEPAVGAKRPLLAALAAAAAVSGAVALAPAATAGCESQVFATYCDGPIRPDGTWDRCFQSAPQATYGQWGQVSGVVPSVGRCYPIDPNAFPPTPLGQPPYHIYP
jgi:hypothetical protein